MAYQTENETLNKKKQANNNSQQDSGIDVEKIKNNIYNTSKELKDQATQAISNSVNNVKERTNEVRDSIANYTADRPFKALGIALGAGALLGYLLGRK